MDNNTLIKYLEYAHRYCAETAETHPAETVRDYWENEANEIEAELLNIDPNWKAL